MVAVDHICVFFASSVSCEAISESAAASVCKCCKGTVSHGRLPVFYIVQTNFVNAQGKSWTGEMDDRNRRVETHRKNAGVSCFTTPRHLFTDNQSSGFFTVFRTVSSAFGRPCKSSEFYSLDDLYARRVSRNATPFRDWTKFHTTDHCAEYFSFYPYYRTHLFNKCV